jgi:hypothetical protein
MNKSVAINIPEIQTYIKSKHKRFLKDVGTVSSKLSQDHQLNLTRIVSKISRVMECFVEAGIIDQFTPFSVPYINDEYSRQFVLKKNGFSDSIYLWTNGYNIVLSDNTIKYITVFVESNVEVIRDVNIDSFDGLEFSKTLLDYIHRKIYSRRESYEAKLFEIPAPFKLVPEKVK